MTGKGFRDLYQERVEKRLLPMLADNGVYNQPEEGGRDPIMVKPGLGALEDLTPAEQRALQKQAWIYQRIVASLMKTSLKTGPDGRTHPPLVRELCCPAGGGTASVAIEIKNCEMDDEVAKADKKIAADEPLFYGNKIKPIQVSFTVILDERRLAEFIEELRVYNPDRRFIPSVYERGDDKKLKEMGEIKQITFDIKKAKITRISPLEDYTVPDREQRVNGNSREDALRKVEEIPRLVKLELALNVLDYNPDYKKSKNRRS
ncbi:MAG: hypothetical protein DRH15_13620 [Deltaproteobacteria bacterium]|nr:MAG: hypothetical protein DRH15_13620 [Deltaproteobacteria bacterium]